MNWDAISGIAEFIGALAIIVTLIYLAIQTRQARIAAEQSAKFAQMQATGYVTEAYARWRGILINSPEIVEAIIKANTGETLTEVEKVQISAAFEELYIACAFAYMGSHASATLQSTSVDVDYLVGYFKNNPSAVDDWHRAKSLIEHVSPEFAMVVDGQMAKLGKTPNQSINTDADRAARNNA